jgi:hypothetical protein
LNTESIGGGDISLSFIAASFSSFLPAIRYVR